MDAPESASINFINSPPLGRTVEFELDSSLKSQVLSLKSQVLSLKSLVSSLKTQD